MMQVVRPDGRAWWVSRRSVLYLVVASVLLGLNGQASSRAFAQAPQPAASGAVTATFRTDRILVKPKRSVDLPVIARLHARSRTQVLHTFPEIGNLQILQLPPGADVQDAIAAYQQSGFVEYAEPDYTVHALLAPNDPRYLDGTLWNLHNTGQNGGAVGADIHAPEGWDIQSTASNVIVAVIDSGIRHTHEDLAPNLWINPGETGLDSHGQNKSSNGVDDDGDGYVDDLYGIDSILGTGSPVDNVGHGTHVSGIIGAVGSNNVGVVGVAWRVRMMDCKFLNTIGQGAGSISDAITCINYARTKGAKIINASWGGYTFTSAALYDAVRSTRDAGIIFVAATGNDGSDNDLTPLYPASYDLDNIIAVMATARTDYQPSWSNFGASSVDIGAPGEDIFSCWKDADDSYLSDSGTSMATAHISGVCAVVWAHYPNESYRQIIGRVLSSVDPLPTLAGYCVTGGRVNLEKALRAPVRPLLSIARSSNQFQFTVQGAPNTVYVLDRSTNLSSWTPFLTNRTGSDGKFTASESITATVRQRLLRVRVLP